jgi:SHS family lactate transporter-like MFS transporter
LPVMLQSLMFFLSAAFWGWCADRFGRRRAIILTAILTIPVAPLYLLTTNYAMIVIFFTLQGAFGGGGMHVQHPHYLSERFPTEVRATASGFCYHQGAIFGGLVGPLLAYFATDWHLGFAIPMLIGTIFASVSLIIAMMFSPETRGTELVSDIVLA